MRWCLVLVSAPAPAPIADATLATVSRLPPWAQVPDGVSDEEALLLGDILSTAFFCAENGGVGPGKTVAVVGCGPVGLLAVQAALHLGASKVREGAGGAWWWA